MRNGQNNKRMRGRSHHHHHNNRKNQNPLTRVYESNGPEVKIRGTASHVAEKYVQLARDAMTSGDPVTAENYHQHAEHYFRLIAAAQEQFRQQNPYYRPENETPNDNTDGTFDDADDGTGQPMQAQGQPNYGNQQPPYPPRDAQPYPPREQPQPSFGGRDQQPHQQGRPQHQHNQHRPQHQQHHNSQQHQPQHQQPQQSAGLEGNDAESLPSFITGGGQPQQNSNQNGYDNQGGDRYQMHRRRRRHRGHHRQDSPGGPQGMSGADAPDNSRPDSD